MKRLAAIMATATIGGVSMAQNVKADDGMVLIKGGTFTMGSPASERMRNADEAQHKVGVADCGGIPEMIDAGEMDDDMSVGIGGHDAWDV